MIKQPANTLNTVRLLMDIKVRSSLIAIGFGNEDLDNCEYWLQNGNHKTITEFLKEMCYERECRFGSMECNLTSLRGGKWFIDDNVWLLFCVVMYHALIKDAQPSFQEVIRSQDNVRLFVDLDSDTQPITEEDVTLIIRLFREHYQMIYDVNLENTEVCILRNMKKPTHKVHIHFPQLITTKSVMKFIAEKTKEYLLNQSSFIDSNYSGLRLVYNYKKDDTVSVYRPHLELDQNVLLDLVKYRVRAFNWEHPPSYRKGMEEYFEILYQANDTDHDPFTQEILTKVWELLDHNAFEAKVSQNGIFLRRKQPSHCDICNRIHEHDNMCVFCSRGNVILKCFRGPTKVLCKYRKPTPEEKEAYIQHQIKRLQKDCRFIPPGYLQVDTYNAVQIKPLDINKSIQLVWSKMDSHKTNNLIRFIQENRQQIRSALFLSPRRKFAENIVARFNAAGLPLINYMTQKIDHHDYVVISSESLYKLKRPYDLVIIDEITSFLSQMNSGLHRENLHINRITLEETIKNAQWIIGLDADIDHRACHFLHTFRPNNQIYLQHNTRKRGDDQNITAIFESEENCWKKIVEFLHNNQNLAIVVGSNEYGKKLAAMLDTLETPNGKIRYRYYHSDGDSYSKDFDNINEAVRNFQVVMYTSTINVGVDIHIEHFDYMFVFGNSQSNHVRDLKQMMGRVRKLRHNTVYIYNKSRSDFYPTKHLEIRQNLINRIDLDNSDVRKYLTDNEYAFYYQNREKIWTLKDNFWTWLLIESNREINLSKNSFDALFRIMLETQGFTIITNAVKQNTMAFGNQLKLLKLKVHHTEETLFDSVTVVNEINFKAIQTMIDNNVATAEDKMIVAKSRFINMLTPDVRDQINGKIYVQNKNHAYNLTSSEHEIDHETKDIVIFDLNMQIEPGKAEYQKHNAIKWFCQMLRIPSTVDRNVIISDEVIKANLPEFIRYYPIFKLLFNLRCKAPSSFKGVLEMIRSIISSWSGSLLTVHSTNKVTVNGNREERFTYTLKAPTEHFDWLLSNMIKKKPPHIVEQLAPGELDFPT